MLLRLFIVYIRGNSFNGLSLSIGNYDLISRVSKCYRVIKPIGGKSKHGYK